MCSYFIYCNGKTQSLFSQTTESPNYISPNKDISTLKNDVYRQSSFNELSIPPSNDDEDAETDPIILRAQAMAIAASNGQKLTPEQLQLIAKPDVQQQKLIEEAKRVSKAKELHNQQQQQQQSQSQSHNLQLIGQQISTDFKKFINEEKEKPPMQWGSDLGKFVQHQSMKISNTSGGGGGATEDSGGDDTTSKLEMSPKGKKKMEGFGSAPSPVQSTPTSSTNKGLWPNMPPLPLLNESITNMLPGNKLGGTESGTTSIDDIDTTNESVIISGILWKRRSGFGKHSTIKAWEKRFVELRGSKLIYYRTDEEKKKEEEKEVEDSTAMKNSGVSPPSGISTPRSPSQDDNAAENSAEQGEQSITTPNNSNNNDTDISASKKLGNIFGQAAQVAEQRIQTAREELTRLASVTGIGHSSAADNTPRGILDLSKESASVSASMGHSGAPSPFCLSIKVKSETKWKFCFVSHGMLMEWLAALTDVIVKSSVDAVADGNHDWTLEEYCIKRGRENENDIADRALVGDNSDVATTVSHTTRSIITGGLPENAKSQWMIAGVNVYIVWALFNVALIIARASSTSIAQYWKLVVFANFAIWQLCTRPNKHSLQCKSAGARKQQLRSESSSTAVARKGHKPIAGDTTVQVVNEEDPNVNKSGQPVPSWIPISSSEVDVRSHGYLTTKQKIPSPGELYECVAVDVFSSVRCRITDVATRVKFDDKFSLVEESSKMNKTWKSPDIFVVSIAIPTEAPRFGQSSDDGQGITIVGYFKMRSETRTILQRITATDYDHTIDASDSETDVQKRIVNGVRLWERYCQEAPNDPSFQARFKLIPAANLEELGCPSYIAKYNGKPVLIKRNQVTGFFTDYPTLNAMEFDISLHPFPYLFKQAMAYLKDYFDKVS